MFGGVSGSAIADTAAIGSLVAPTMKEKGYHPDFTARITSYNVCYTKLLRLAGADLSRHDHLTTRTLS